MHTSQQAVIRWLLICVGLMLLPGCAISQHAKELHRRSLQGFASPAATTETGLLAADGFRPGKIPVVFIHGLMSDALTWDETIAQLKTDPQIAADYQFWTYRYPTGQSYLQSAAGLRSELADTLDRLDPQRHDPVLHQVVLVGHSMGGLIAKLQVTSSRDLIWKTISDQSIQQVVDDPAMRADLSKAVYFVPQIRVSRVIFIATPHAGSDLTQHPVGRWGSWLVRFPQELQTGFDDWIAAKGDQLKSAPSRIPTSIDHLDPESTVLQATRILPFSPRVVSHSIIGKGHKLQGAVEADGVVSTSSAHLPQAASELTVDASHVEIHRHPDTVVELKRLLHLHRQAQQGQSQYGAAQYGAAQYHR